MKALEKETGVKIPAGLRGLEEKPVLHKNVCSAEAMAEAVMDALK